MNTDEAIAAFPVLATVVGADWMRTHPGWFEGRHMPLPVWFAQLNSDLGILSAQGVSVQGYGAMLRDEPGFLTALLEIHGASLLARVSTQLSLHVPRSPGDATNFDVLATIAGSRIAAECKTRADGSPSISRRLKPRMVSSCTKPSELS